VRVLAADAPPESRSSSSTTAGGKQPHRSGWSGSFASTPAASSRGMMWPRRVAELTSTNSASRSIASTCKQISRLSMALQIDCALASRHQHNAAPPCASGSMPSPLRGPHPRASQRPLNRGTRGSGLEDPWAALQQSTHKAQSGDAMRRRCTISLPSPAPCLLIRQSAMSTEHSRSSPTVGLGNMQSPWQALPAREMRGAFVMAGGRT
jgi:hypothetical protein